MKRTIKTNIHVEVTVPDDRKNYLSCPFQNNLEQYLIYRADEIVKSIKKHCDVIGDCFTAWNTEEVCSFCGLQWDVDESGCPYCCDKAIIEWKECNVL